MRIEITDEIPAFQKNCCFGVLVYAAISVLGVVAMGVFARRPPEMGIATVLNSTDRDLKVRFEGGLWPSDTLERLGAMSRARFRAFAKDPRSSSFPCWIRVYSDAPASRLLAQYELTDGLVPLDRGTERIVIRFVKNRFRIRVAKGRP